MKNIDLSVFSQTVLADIPLLQHMGVHFTQYDGNYLRLDAPLAPNKNDKQTGFGGSIVTLATVCGWAMVSLQTAAHDLRCDVVVAESQISYQQPVLNDFYATTMLTRSKQNAFINNLYTKQTCSLKLSVNVLTDTQIVAKFQGTYVARLSQQK